MVALVITFWGSVNDELGSCDTGKAWEYGPDRCTCTRAKYFSTEKWEMGKSTFFEIYPNQARESCIPSNYVMSTYFQTINKLSLTFQNARVLVVLL